MSESKVTSPPDAPQPREGDDVDALLSEAESLARSITEDTDVESPGSAETGVASTDERDATEAASEDRSEAQQQVVEEDDAPQSVKDLPSADDETASQRVEGRHAADVASAEPLATLDHPEAAESAPAESAPVEAAEPEAPVSADVTQAESDATPDTTPDVDSAPEGDTSNTAPADTTASASQQDAADPVAAESPLESGRWRSVLAATGRAAGGIVRATIAIPPRVAASVFTVLDWPFAWIPQPIKSYLGIIGLITLIMGLVAWFLPGLLESNPYVDMPRYAQ